MRMAYMDIAPNSFHTLTASNKRLLDSLKISKVAVVAHSMGGILATRFTRLQAYKLTVCVPAFSGSVFPFHRRVPVSLAGKVTVPLRPPVSVLVN